MGVVLRRVPEGRRGRLRRGARGRSTPGSQSRPDHPRAPLPPRVHQRDGAGRLDEARSRRSTGRSGSTPSSDEVGRRRTRILALATRRRGAVGPAARAPQRPGPGSASGRATTSTAPKPSPASASTSELQARARARTPCAPARRRRGRARPAARAPREHVAVGDLAHRDVGDERLRRPSSGSPIASGFVPDERLAAVGVGEPRRATSPSAPRRARRRRAGAPSSRASRSGSSSTPTTTRACSGGSASCASHDRGQRQVAERAVAVPALVAGLGEEPSRPRVRVEVGQRLEPLDPREAVAELAAPLGVEEVLGERRRRRPRRSRARRSSPQAARLRRPEPRRTEHERDPGSAGRSRRTRIGELAELSTASRARRRSGAARGRD